MAIVPEFQRELQQGLEPDRAEFGLFERQAFGILVLRRVVRRDAVDGAVGKSGDDGLSVLFAAQRRRHAPHGMTHGQA